MSTAESKDELREGLIVLLRDNYFANLRQKADAVLAYLRAHGTHAEFVRAVRKAAFEIRVMHEAGSFEGIRSANIVALCDAELKKVSHE